MISSSENTNELSFLVFNLGQFKLRIFSFQNVGIYQGGFVAKVLGALPKMLREEGFSLIFQNVALWLRDAVPKLRFTLMEKVNSW